MFINNFLVLSEIKFNEIKNVFTIEARLGFESPLSHLTSEVIPAFKCQGNKRGYN